MPPNKIATTHIAMPPFDLPTMDKTSPKIAKGIFNQFSHPKSGIIPNTIPINARMPKSRPIVFIYC